MAGNIGHESTILVTAKLNEEHAVKEINKQIETLGSKLNKVKVDISVNDISKTNVAKVTQQAQKNIQNTFNGMRLDLGQANFNDILNVKQIDVAKQKLESVASDIGKNLGKVSNVSFTGTKSGIVDFENGTKATVTYIQELENGLKRTTKAVYQFNQESEQFEAHISSMNTDYGKMDNVFKKQQERLNKLQESYKNTSFKVDEFNQKVNYMAFPIQDTEKTDNAFNQLAEEQQKLNNLRTKYSVNLPEQEQLNLLSQLETQLKKCQLAYKEYNAEVKSANSPVKDAVQQQSILNSKIEKAQSEVRTLANAWSEIENDSLKNELNNLISKSKELKTNADLTEFNAQVSALKAKYKEFDAEIKSANKSVKDSAQHQSILNSKIEKAQSEVRLIANTWTKIKYNTSLNNELNNLISKSKELKTTADLSEFNAQLSTFKTKCKEAGVATSTFVSGLKEAWKHFGYFFSASRLFYLAIQGLKNVYSNIKDVDSAMVELKKVTDETDSSYSKFLKNAKKDSQELGSNLSDFINATADFARLGYSVSESEDLAKVATMYKNVGDDLSGIDEATSTIVSTLKAFNMNASEAESIIDKLNEVSNNFAVSSGDLGDGLANSASALAVAGNDINQTIALLTAGTEITQDASEMGNSIKVLSLRLRGMKGELESLGEEIDDNVDSISKMQTQILNLTNGKVNIFDSNGNFKSTYEIVKGISEVYSSLSSTNQAALLETIAGKQRANQIAALITNFKQAEKAFTSSENSGGSALKEQERWLDSIEGRINTLQSSFQSLSTDFVNSSEIKDIVEVLTDLVNGLDGLINKIGLLPVAISAIGIGNLIKNLGTIKGNITNISTAFTEISLMMTM